MKRINLYRYNSKNLEDILNCCPNLRVVTSKEIFRAAEKTDQWDEWLNNLLENHDLIDISLLMNGESERIETWITHLVLLVQSCIRYDHCSALFVIQNKYAQDVCDALPYFITDSGSLERYLKIDFNIITNIVDIQNSEFDNLQEYLNRNLFGNQHFKNRLVDYLKGFRYFNRIGEHKIFSAFICGPTGIGKTETARLLHTFLSPGENFIKINLGNYSDHNALSSLIGSPRGYVGSSQGELSRKIERSKSSVILIDEFEKSSREVHNFFLELLSDGCFTDSLGHEFDLNKYIIIFTSNIKEQELSSKISPELRSRFDLMYKMVLLSDEDKMLYIKYKVKYYVKKIQDSFDVRITNEEIEGLQSIDVSSFSNLRNLNKCIESKISNLLSDKKVE